MKPYGRHGLDIPQRIYNYWTSYCRRVYENAFGILANWFGCLLTNINFQPDIASTIVLAATGLEVMIGTSTDDVGWSSSDNKLCKSLGLTGFFFPCPLTFGIVEYIYIVSLIIKVKPKYLTSQMSSWNGWLCRSLKCHSNIHVAEKYGAETVQLLKPKMWKLEYLTHI